MAPVDDALDRLDEEYVGRILSEDEALQADRALATVRSELERLREERDAAHRTAAVECERAEAAEAEVRQLREERPNWSNACPFCKGYPEEHKDAPDVLSGDDGRSEERRVGKECRS